MVINFFGRRGTGKTTAIKGQLLDCRPPVVIIDVLGNYTDNTYYNTTDLVGSIQAIKEFYEYAQNQKLPNGAAKNFNHPKRIISLRTSNPTLAADYLSAALWEVKGGTLVLDEVDSIRLKEGSCFDEFIRYGRNHGGDLITGSRRPAEIDRNLTAAANKFYCFQTHEPRDIDYFSEVFGERAEQLLEMPKFSGLFLDHDKNVVGVFYIDREGHIFHAKEITA